MNPLSALLGVVPVGTLILWGVVGLVLLVFLLIMFNFFFVWLRAFASGAPVTFSQLIALRLRSVPVSLIVDTRITAVKSGMEASIDQLSSHYLAGGNVEMVIRILGTPFEAQFVCRLIFKSNRTAETVTATYAIIGGFVFVDAA